MTFSHELSRIGMMMPRWVERLAVVGITGLLAVVTAAVILQGEDVPARVPADAGAERTSASSSPDGRLGGAELEVLEVVSTAASKRIDGTEYVIIDGDRLENIAIARYGTPRATAFVLASNPGVDPLRLQVGQRLVLPDWDPEIPSVKPAPAARTPVARPREAATETNQRPEEDPALGLWVVVQKGDTLEGLARKHLGRRSAWPLIVEANRTRLPNPDRIVPGVRILIPAALAEARNEVSRGG